MAAPTRAGGLTGWIRSRAARLDGPRRQTGVDLARGLAVVGMFAAHLLTTVDFVWETPSTWTDVVNGRSSILFATLAGVSLALVSGGPVPLGADRLGVVRGRIGVRAACIWLIGVLLLLLSTPVYVILPAYGLLFVVALPALRLRATALFASASAIAVLGPVAVWGVNRWSGWGGPEGSALAAVTGWHYPFLLWAAFLFAGMGVGRLDLRRVSTVCALGLCGAALAVFGYGVIGRAAQEQPAGSVASALLSADAHSSGIGEAVGSGGLALAVIACCLLLCRTPVRWGLWPLRALGSMPLTAYTAQLVVWALLQPEPTLLQTEVGAFRSLDPFWPLTLGTIAGCTLWALLVGRGPLESLISFLARAFLPTPPPAPASPAPASPAPPPS